MAVSFESLRPWMTKVVLEHTGWGMGEEWNKAYDYFQQAWDIVLRNLTRRFITGPSSGETKNQKPCFHSGPSAASRHFPRAFSVVK